MKNTTTIQHLDLAGCRRFANTLGDTPETAISYHLLTRGLCRAWVAGEIANFAAAIVQATDFPSEPVGFGSDAEALWDLLQLIQGWICLLVDVDVAADLGDCIENEMNVNVRYLEDIYHLMIQQAAVIEHPNVRLLTLDDLPLLEAAPLELRGNLWGDARALLSRGVIACAIERGEIVATALNTARSRRYADIGVYTRPEYRHRGLASAAASLVARRVQGAGYVPIWSTGAHNVASLRLAEKLGFVEISWRVYIIPEV